MNGRSVMTIILGAVLLILAFSGSSLIRSLGEHQNSDLSFKPMVYAKIPPSTSPLPDQTLTGSSLVTSPLIKELSGNAQKMLGGFIATSKAFDLDFAGQSQFVPESATISTPEGESTRVQIESKDANFNFDKETHRMTGFFVRSEPTPPPKLESTEPKWTSDRALEIGTAFRAILVGSLKVKFGPPKIKFTPPFGKGVDDPQNQHMDYHEGEWSIAWGRLNEEGIPFGGDEVWVRLSEKRGIFFATCYLSDSYVPEVGEPMRVNDAIAIAKRSRPSFGTQPDDIVNYSVKSSEMEIVHPGFQQAQPSRLAWVIWLQPIRSSFKAGPTYDDSQCVVVDAHNGEIIAINAML